MSKEKGLKQPSCQTIKEILFLPSKNSSKLKVISLLINPLIFKDRNLTSVERYKILTYSVVEIPTSPQKTFKNALARTSDILTNACNLLMLVNAI